MRRSGARLWLSALLLPLVACGSGQGTGAGQSASENLSVSPQNSTLLVGLNRISVALLDMQQNPVSATNVTVQIVNASGKSMPTRPLENIGPEYGGIPVYVGVADFTDVGQYEYVVRGKSRSGQPLTGHSYVTVAVHGPEVPVGARVPRVRQAILGDAGVTIAMIDSGVPPDTWHRETVAQGLDQHRPLVLYFGDPAYCPSKTCGPTHQILAQLCAQFCAQLLFEHIETYYPAGPPGPNAHVNPAFDAFGLQTDPWIYFVDSSGVVTDRYQGPVTLHELVQSAQGTLAGKVPAIALG